MRKSEPSRKLVKKSDSVAISTRYLIALLVNMKKRDIRKNRQNALAGRPQARYTKKK